jgi:magnesium transporter
MNKAILEEKIHRLLGDRNVEELKHLADELHPSVVVEALDSFAPGEIGYVLDLLDPRQKAEIFGFFSQERQLQLMAEMDEAHATEVITYLSHDERVDLLNELPDERKNALVKLLAQKEREDIRRLEAYEEGTVGAVMTSDYVTLSPDMTEAQAIDKLRHEAPDAETIYYAYVLDEERHIAGVVTLKHLIVARPGTKVRDIMKSDVIALYTRAPAEEAVRELRKSDLIALPVLDRQGKMVGIVTHDDVHDIQEEEATEDFHRMAAAPGLTTVGMRGTTVAQMIQKRLPWLLVLVFVNIFSGAGIAFFEDTIEAVVALVFFLPLLIDSGGNAGSQSATLMVRALAVGDVRLRDWFYFLRREVGIALAMGLAMGAAVSAVALFRAPEVTVVVAVTMVCTILVGSLIGMLLPFLLTRFRMDPATASAPLITSLADIAGVLIYFSIATWYLGLM